MSIKEYPDMCSLNDSIQYEILLDAKSAQEILNKIMS